MRSDSFGLKNCSVTCIGAGTLDPRASGLEHQRTTETGTIRYDNWLVGAVACGHWVRLIHNFVCFTL